MGSQTIIIPSKETGEWVPVTADFTSRLPLGVTITSVSNNMQVFSGIDSNPLAMLNGNPIVNGSVVIQNIKGGNAGVTYVLFILAYGSDGNIYEMSGYVSVTSALI